MEAGLKYSKSRGWLLPKARDPKLELNENNLVLRCFLCGIKHGDSSVITTAEKNSPDMLQKCNEILIEKIMNELKSFII